LGRQRSYCQYEREREAERHAALWTKD
jgi:hypothetical protein